MIEKTNLENIELVGNYLIVKPDPNFDFVPVQGPEGEIKIHLNYNPQDESKHVSIKGVILKAPDQLSYYNEVLVQSAYFSQQERASLMRNSMPYRTEMNVKAGQTIYFDYHNQFQADDEGRLIEIDGHGTCLLMSYETFFGKEENGEFVPLNGYVIFKRDQSESEYQTESGLTVIKTIDVYESSIGVVIAADKPVRGYLDKGIDNIEELNPGDRIYINKKFGCRIAYYIHGGDMRDYEVIRRKHIFGKLDDIISDIKKYHGR